VPGRNDARRLVRRSPRSLIAFAIVIATLCGGTVAFAMLGKTVKLDVDGRQVTVQTFASNVAGVLRKAHIHLGVHDTVAPDVGAPVRDGSKVIVRHGRLIDLTVDGQQRQVWVTALSVADAVQQLGLQADGAWISASRSLGVPRQGLSLAVRLPQHVTVIVDGHRLTTTTTAPDVGALLSELDVSVGRLDHVSTALSTYPTDGRVVTIDRISQKMVRQSVATGFRVIKVKSNALYVGQSRVARYGQPGVKVNTYRVVWKNRRIFHRVLVASQVRAKSVPEVLQVGTKPKPRYSPSADGLNWPALARCESGGNPRSVSSNGKYRGLYQFTLGTWHGVGGSGDPIDASSSEQTYRAQLLYRRSGDSPWPTCGHYLYS
jgi:uncharacterized protein YabE (DUF348 family)